jgi:hypothetical protein
MPGLKRSKCPSTKFEEFRCKMMKLDEDSSPHDGDSEEKIPKNGKKKTKEPHVNHLLQCNIPKPQNNTTNSPENSQKDDDGESEVNNGPEKRGKNKYMTPNSKAIYFAVTYTAPATKDLPNFGMEHYIHFTLQFLFRPYRSHL